MGRSHKLLPTTQSNYIPHLRVFTLKLDGAVQVPMLLHKLK